MKTERTELEVANGFRLFDLCIDIIQNYLTPDRPFALRPYLVQEMQKRAVDGIEVSAGNFRSGPVAITGSSHNPPPAFLVSSLVSDLCDYVNDNWHEKNAFHLSAYCMWRINWIHAFTDGNGRTARTLSYAVLCIKLGSVLPGTPTVPQQIEEDKTLYIQALEAADKSIQNGELDLQVLERMIRDMLARQLLGVIEAAGGEALLDP